MINKSFCKFCSFALILLPVIAHCEISEEVYCFNSSGAGSKSFGLHVLCDDAERWSGAFVKYRGAKSAITLASKDEISEEISPWRPNQVTVTWYEIYNGIISGEYEMMSQGANIYSMTYKSYVTHKQVAFIFNPEALEKGGEKCTW